MAGEAAGHSVLGAAGDASEEGEAKSNPARAELDSAAESPAGPGAPVFVQE